LHSSFCIGGRGKIFAEKGKGELIDEKKKAPAASTNNRGEEPKKATNISFLLARKGKVSSTLQGSGE